MVVVRSRAWSCCLPELLPLPNPQQQPRRSCLKLLCSLPWGEHSSMGRVWEERKGARRDIRQDLDAQAILWHWSHCCCIDFQAFLSPSLNSWFFSHLAWMESAWRNGMSSHGIQSVLQRGGRSSSLASLQTGPATYWIAYKLCVLVLRQNIPFYCLWNPILISPRVLIVNFSTFICILSLCANSFPAVVNIFCFSFCIDGAVNSNLIHSIFGKTS